jgi:hypothetical protein
MGFDLSALYINLHQGSCLIHIDTEGAGLRTKAKLWESLRSLFKVLVYRTMTALYRHMAYQYDIQLK